MPWITHNKNLANQIQDFNAQTEKEKLKLAALKLINPN